MKIIRPSVEYWGQCPTDLAGNLALIERAGRLCYKSEDKIGCLFSDQDFIPDQCLAYKTPSFAKDRCRRAECPHHSAGKFVEKLTKAGHWAMLEHSNLVLRENGSRYDDNSYSLHAEGTYLNRYADLHNTYTGGNLRAWLEVTMMSDLTQLYKRAFRNWEICPHDEIPAELHRYTVKFICDRGVSHELVRHRPCSFAQESTRYCDYAGEVVFVEPWWWEERTTSSEAHFSEACADSEWHYEALREQDFSPQAARAVLPNALKTEIVVTADAAEWGIIKKLRLHKAAHPDMRRIMAMVPWEQIEGGTK